MEIGLSTNDVKLITIIQQVCSVLSLVGCLFIITTFCLCDAFHKPINRLVFYASFGNIMASICFIMADSFIDAPNGAGCQTQAFLLHTFVGADALWTLAMAINVYLAFYYRFDAQRLRKMELPYLLLCYGIPFLPAFIFIFVKNGDGVRVYGSAVQWCWITSSWDTLRIATFYGPIQCVFLIPPAKILAEFLKRRYLTIAPSSKPNMSAHSFFRPHRRIRKSTPPRTPSEPLGSTLPSTPTSVSTPTDILVLDDGASTPTIADERQIPTSSQCVFPINWDKIRYDGKPVPSIRYRQPHKRTLNSKLQPSAIYKHGAQLTTDGDNKYWLCKYCHIRG
ncbi:hypothetical protein HZ326_29283, partial [Fusarium oxysporum f. sp. albedinis]